MKNATPTNAPQIDMTTHAQPPLLNGTLSTVNGQSPRKRRCDFLLFNPPNIGEEEIAEVVDTLRSTWITTGPKTKRFEENFAAYTGNHAALAVNSCTAGLHLALTALGIGPGDEVITTDMTFAASVNVIEHVGARPVLVDVARDTLNIDPAAVREAITERTKAILPVHFAGHPAEMDTINGLAAQHELSVVEDAAHALPARYKGRLIGGSNNLTAFSFYATKNLSTAEGGMLTGEAKALDRARMLSLHGMSRDAWKRYDKSGGRNWFYEIQAPGFKYNMMDIQAALGLHQLAKLNAFHARRQSIAARYNDLFGSSEYFEVPCERPEVTHAWHLYTLRLRTDALRIGRDQFIEELAERNIGTSVHFIPIHLHPYYRDKYGFGARDFPVAMDAFERILSIPLHPALTDDDVDDVASAVWDVAQRNRR